MPGQKFGTKKQTPPTWTKSSIVLDSEMNSDQKWTENAFV
ncbi:hypothetical protein HMPREF1868_01230 [Olsenella sp. DNF00959]|nr:hypothetical protein HMPREF1868_01230 [Olsenella sp. DNF00959]